MNPTSNGPTTGAPEKPKPWDQLPEETDAAYRRFLLFRNLGPGRTLRKAYRAVAGAFKGNKRRHVPGSWVRDAVQFRWMERTRAWDIAALRDASQDVALVFTETLKLMSKSLLAALQSGKAQPNDWDKVLKSVEVLSGLIIPLEGMEKFAKN